MKENYIYPAIFSKGEEGETEIRFVVFPDILTYSETDDIDDVVRTAQDILALTIMDYEAEKKELPKPSSDIKGAAYIHIWMPYFRNNIKEIYVKKTVTIPQWLDILAKGKKVNFSAAMVRGIKEELGIENR